MGTIYEAIELWSANLHQQVRMLAQRRGWATRAYPYLLSWEPLRFIAYTATTVHLPKGLGASFTPQHRPLGEAWIIDVRRTDGLVPDGAVGGLLVMRGADEGFGLRAPSGELTDAHLARILDELNV